MSEGKKYTLAGIMGGLFPVVFLVLIGFLEILLREYEVACLLSIVLGILWLAFLLTIEPAVLKPVKPHIWVLIYFGSALVGTLIGTLGSVLYLDMGYHKINYWDHGFLAGIQWFIYLIVLYAAELLWLLIRGIILIVKHVSRKKNSVDKMVQNV